MNLSGFNKMLAVGLILLFVLPATSVPGESPGAGSARREGRAAPDHNAQTTLSDFSGMQMSGVEQRPLGGLALQRQPGAWQTELVAVSHAQSTYVHSVATDSKNDFILVWWENRNGVDSDIYAQWFDERGNTKGGEIAVCTAPGNQTHPVVAVNSKGQFAVCWWDDRDGGAYVYDLYCQFFDASGAKVGSEMQVTSFRISESSISIAAGRSDDFMIVWSDNRNQNTTGYNIFGQIIDSNGTYSGGAFPVTLTPGGEISPLVAPAHDGGFLVIWLGLTGTEQICAQRMDAAGGKLGDVINVTNGAVNKGNPAIAANPLGGYIVAWDMNNGGPSGSDIFAQRLDQNGTLLGTTVSVSSADHSQQFPNLVIDSHSDSFVVWEDDRSDYGDVYGQWLDPNGTKVGPEVKIIAAPIVQANPVIAVDGNDDMVVAWMDQLVSSIYQTSVRQFMNSYVASGNVAAGDIAPSGLWAWNNITAKTTIDHPAVNTISFDYSTDGGSSWQAVPSNGSLTGAGASPKLRVRADLATTDNLFSPVLNSITVNYLVNRPPAISLPASLQGFVGTAVNITASASDPDGDMLSVRWTQFSGSDLSINGTTGATLTFIPAKPGLYTLSATANDGFNDSPPATVDLTVTAIPVPTLTVTAPTQGQLVNTTTLVVTFTVANYAITQTGGHIHYQLDSAGEVMWFSTAPFNLTGLTEGNHVLKVYLASANHTRLPNPESYVTVNFTVGNLPQLPDLSIAASDLKLTPSNPKDGDSVTLSVTVHNTGTADAGAFTVRFFVDGTALPDQDVVLLSKGGSKVVEAKWKAKSGSHNISVEVNPGGGLPEKSISNNDSSVKLSVSKSESGGASMLLIGVVVLIIIVAVVALAVMMMRRRKPTTVIPYQPPAQQALAAPQAPPPPAQ